MKSVFFILAVWLLLPHHAIGQQNYYWPRISHDAFRRGEKLCYRIHYGFIDAVRAQIEITGENKQFQNRNTLHVIGTGWSKGTFDFFFKVRDRYETYIDEEALVPHQFIRRVDEGGYRMSQDYLFNHPLRKVNDNGKWYSIPENIQDMLSGFYLARTFSFGAASLNQVYTVPTLVDGELYQLQIRFKG
ncbi:MAG TPA: DUF3108 domain-containing protein, partial [Chitinophagaceae bacterium]|nr:DUF3108 domain-containing protein [Chitinophagaceae bacterium]